MANRCPGAYRAAHHAKQNRRPVIDVAFTREQLRPADIAVVVDVLRATSTATQALAAGYRRVTCAETIELACGLRAPGRVLAGERYCVRPPGFDQGNSPAETIQRRGDELVLATTNGAPTIVTASKHAPQVLVACLLNLAAVQRTVIALAGEPEGDIQIGCSGTAGAVALEDVYVAGRLSAALQGERTDAALIAEAVARAFDSPLAALTASANAAMLRHAGLAGDIAYCALESELDLVPAVVATNEGMAALEVLRARERRDAGSGVDATDTVTV